MTGFYPVKGCILKSCLSTYFLKLFTQIGFERPSYCKSTLPFLFFVKMLKNSHPNQPFAVSLMLPL